TWPRLLLLLCFPTRRSSDLGGHRGAGAVSSPRDSGVRAYRGKERRARAGGSVGAARAAAGRAREPAAAPPRRCAGSLAEPPGADARVRAAAPADGGGGGAASAA